MTSILWPSSIPSAPKVGTYSEVPRVYKSKFESEVGPPIERRTSTIKISDVKYSIVMSDDQLEQFERFVLDTLQQGVLKFYMTHPRTLTQVAAKFDDDPFGVSWLAPAYGSVPGYWEVSINLMVFGQ